MKRMVFILTWVGVLAFSGPVATRSKGDVAPEARTGKRPAAGFKKLALTDKFYCEGAYYGDFNKDGKPDVVAGPFWYEGPGFRKKHQIRPPKAFDPKGYSDNFLTFTGDFNGDGWTDVFYAP